MVVEAVLQDTLIVINSNGITLTTETEAQIADQVVNGRIVGGVLKDVGANHQVGAGFQNGACWYMENIVVFAVADAPVGYIDRTDPAVDQFYPVAAVVVEDRVVIDLTQLHRIVAVAVFTTRTSAHTTSEPVGRVVELCGIVIHFQAHAIAVGRFRPGQSVAVADLNDGRTAAVEEPNLTASVIQTEFKIAYHIGNRRIDHVEGVFPLSNDLEFARLEDGAIRNFKLIQHIFALEQPSADVDLSCAVIVKFYPILTIQRAVRIVHDLGDGKIIRLTEQSKTGQHKGEEESLFHTCLKGRVCYANVKSPSGNKKGRYEPAC